MDKVASVRPPSFPLSLCIRAIPFAHVTCFLSQLPEPGGQSELIAAHMAREREMGLLLERALRRLSSDEAKVQDLAGRYESGMREMEGRVIERLSKLETAKLQSLEDRLFQKLNIRP